MDLQEERETWAKIKEARTDAQWPDEVDTPLSVEARVRFQKYRGLESFRASPWDPKENLPLEYARVYQFKNFDRTKRRILKEMEDETLIGQIDRVDAGTYVVVSVANVSAKQLENWKHVNDNVTLVLYGLLPHEHQMSVVNVVLKRSPDSTIPIKSKEQMIVQCGFRRFIVNPIFSQHTNSDRHKVSNENPQYEFCCFTYIWIYYIRSTNGISVRVKRSWPHSMRQFNFRHRRFCASNRIRIHHCDWLPAVCCFRAIRIALF